MGIRSTLKSVARELLGRPAPAPPSAPVQAPVTPPPAPRAAVPIAPPVIAPAPPPAPAAEPAAPSADMEAKAARHLEKTHRGVLRYLDERGGTAPLGEMHDHSERRYFIAHRKFSDLMEAMISAGHIDYDHSQGIATLTEAGRAFAKP